MSKQFPIELLGDLSFLKTAFRGSCVAILDSIALYKGGTNSICLRRGLAANFYGHLFISRTRKKVDTQHRWDRFAILGVGRVRYLKDMETLLLQVAKPPGNSLSGHVHRDANLTRSSSCSS